MIYSGLESSQNNSENWYLGPTNIGDHDPNDPVTSLFSLSSARNRAGLDPLNHYFFSADPISGSLSIGTQDIDVNSNLYVLEDGNKDSALRIRHEGPANTFGVYGIFSSSAGSALTSRYGVFAFAGGSSAGNYGLYGNTDATGTHYGVYASGNLAYTATLTNASDRKFKRNISTFQALDRIMKLAPKTYEMKREKFQSMNLAPGRQFGFIAQELQEIFPELVHESLNTIPWEDKDGRITTEEIDYLGVDYISMVPILTQAMQEQQQIIEAKEERIRHLEERLEQLEILVWQLMDPSNTAAGVSTGASLMQNQPNPSRTSTTIPYFIPQSIQKAELQIADASGRILEKFNLQERGYGNFTLNTEQLSSGIYFYSLLADGKIIATRKMVTGQ